MPINDQYVFLPWLRKGLASKITQTENTIPTNGPLLRATMSGTVQINNSTSDYSISKDFKLFGPGDIVRLNASAIVRTDPSADITNFESNYLASIDFYEEDLPWRYTPAVAHDSAPQRLSPWMCLIALKKDEYSINTEKAGFHKIVLTQKGITAAAEIFPPQDQLWAWAHVQVNKSFTGLPDDDIPQIIAQIEQNPNIAFSRILCPRRLDNNTAYTCFLIPTFESGRLAGLGLDPEATRSLERAWNAGSNENPSQYPNEFPFYHSWSFQTAILGDFETLASYITPRPVPETANGRPIFIGSPGMGLIQPETGSDGAMLLLEGALQPPDYSPTNIKYSSSHKAFINDLTQLLNHDTPDSELMGDTTQIFNRGPQNGSFNPIYGEFDDPGVLPPIYGQWHAKNFSITAGSKLWIKELNLDPRNRIAAGLGTQIVKENQEQFMEQAWEQVEEVMNANQRIRQAELAAKVGDVLFEKHIVHPNESLNDQKVISRALRMTSRMHKSIRTEGLEETVKYNINKSRIPDALLDPAFRKISRPGKKANMYISKVNHSLKTTNDSELTTSFISRHNNQITDESGKMIETYPFYRKRMAPADAIPHATVTDLSAKIESVMVNVGDGSFTFMDPDITINDKSFTNQSTHLKIRSESKQETQKAPSNQNAAINSLIAEARPSFAVLERLKTNVEVWSKELNSFIPVGNFKQISASLLEDGVMEYPEIDTPIYELLENISPDYIIPNIGDLPENSATLMKVNTRFIESLFVGLNHEMSRELIWREFPTDQRGSYFRMFWDKSDSPSIQETEEEYDISPLDTWQQQNCIGENTAISSQYIVLVVRGQLLQKFPDTMIFAQPAKYVGSDAVAHNNAINSPTSDLKIDTSLPALLPVFRAKLANDVTLVGFELDVDVAKGTNSYGYYFGLQERPGQLRFGLDDDETITSCTTWDNLTWQLLNSQRLINTSEIINPTTSAGIEWGQSSAHMASILFQKPVLFMIHAKEMLAS
jgi:hypothetical protein